MNLMMIFFHMHTRWRRLATVSDKVFDFHDYRLENQ